ncbi:MAG: carbohydrate ABC transporter permease [Chloroflexi bacterium]|nr:carbohydrate ABC transporter permease [Chloroflexota bacterium]
MSTIPVPRSRVLLGLDDSARARAGRILTRAFLYLLMALIIFVVAFPLFWMISTSFKSKTEIYVTPPTLLPTLWTLQNYIDLFWITKFGAYYRNSIIVAGSATLLSISVGSLAAYSLSRFRFLGFALYLRVILFTYMLPSALLMIPLYILAVDVGLQDTLIGLIIANSTSALPFTIWLLRSYFRTIPIELEEAAMIDGCGRLGAFYRVVLPLALPGIIATSLFAFTAAWNEFLYALVFISTDDLRTLPVGLNSWVRGGDSQMDVWSMLLAAAVLTTAPVLVFYGLVQRHLVVDLSAGGTKS